MAKTYPTCTVDECGTRATRKKMCDTHYRRFMRLGTTELPSRPTVEERFWSKVEKTGACWNWVGAQGELGYGRFGINNRAFLSHRVAYEMSYGPIPEGALLDHVCHNASCVRPTHLRLATEKQNNEYRKGAQRNNKSSGVRGVRKHGPSWRATVKHHGKVYYLGVYPTIAEADAAAKAKRAELFTFPEYNQEEAA